MHRLMLLGCAAVAVELFSSISLASEQLPGDPVAGRRLAEGWCVACHEIEPQIRGPGLFAAPAFQDVADDSAVTELGLRVFLQTPHFEMPNEQLSPAQIDDVISYILNLRRPR